jgi:hypothetical protein
MISIKTPNTSSLLAIAWPLTIAGTAFVLGAESIKGWLVAGIMACGPAAVLWYTTRTSARTTSQLIQEAKR